jgi:WD40 repeat protein
MPIVGRHLKGHSKAVNSIARGSTADATSWLLLSGSDDGTARLWDARTCSSVRMFATASPVCSVLSSIALLLLLLFWF